MVRRTKTFEVSYNYFEPGTLVTPTSTRCPLNVEKVYRVRECHEPMYAEDEAICFVSEHPSGEDHRTGISTEYLRTVAIGELIEDQSRLTRPNFWHNGEENVC